MSLYDYIIILLCTVFLFIYIGYLKKKEVKRILKYVGGTSLVIQAWKYSRHEFDPWSWKISPAVGQLRANFAAAEALVS